MPKFDLAKLSSEELINQFTNHNDWFRRSAREQLVTRRDTNSLPRLRALALQTNTPALSLQSLWSLHTSGGFDEATAVTLLTHPHAPMRAWTVRLLGDAKTLSPELLPRVVALARAEKNSSVRNQLACSAKRWPPRVAQAVVRELLRHDEDVNDPQIPLLLWWAIEENILRDRSDGLGVLNTVADWQVPMMRAHILERLARRFASGSDLAARQASAWMLNTTSSAAHRELVLRGFDKAWEGQRAADRVEVRHALGRVWSPTNALMLRVGLRVDLPEAQRRAVELLNSTAAPESERVALAETLGQCGVRDAVTPLLGWLQQNSKLQLAAVGALQNFDEPRVAAALIEHDAKFSTAARARARAVLASRATWSAELMRAVEREAIPAKEISPDLLRQMLRHNDTALTAAIEKRWGKLQAQSSAEKANTVNQLKLVLNPSGTTLRFPGDAAEGKKLFTALCANCHQFRREGQTIGPELTGADRKNTDWLLGQIVDPSAFIRPEYVNHNVEMKDGRSLTGLLVEQSDAALTVLDAQNQRTVLNRADVKDLNASATSLMPEGLLESLTPKQVRDLFAYLQAAP